MGAEDGDMVMQEAAEAGMDGMEECAMASTPELEAIYHQEKHHFTTDRLLFIVVNFAFLFANNFIFKNEALPKWQRFGVVAVFTVAMIALTAHAAKRVKKIHEIKEDQGYRFDENDMRFEKTADLIKLALFCMIAAALCGMTGIAGGMVLGPLFLSYNMVPSVMAGTNQYITMIASMSVVLQFIYLDELYWHYAILFGVMTLLAAYAGIKSIKYYVEKTGKQSVITIILVVVLASALLSLPLKYLVLPSSTNAGAAAVVKNAPAKLLGLSNPVELMANTKMLTRDEREARLASIKRQIDELVAESEGLQGLNVQSV